MKVHRLKPYWKILLVLIVGLFIVLISLMGNTPPVKAQDPDKLIPKTQAPLVSEPVKPRVINIDLRTLPPLKLRQPGAPVRQVPRRTYRRSELQEKLAPPIQSSPDPLLAIQAKVMPTGLNRAFSTPNLNFAGLSFSWFVPPDTVGDVGPNHYIQMVNGTLVQIFDKSGSSLAGPFYLDTLWVGGGNCAVGGGDPIVLYDPLADRWLLSEFANLGNHLCVYVSQGPNPVSDGWYGYDFTTPEFPDYPKYAVWPDAYYVSSNEFHPAVYALDRTQMLSGGVATWQRFTASSLAGFVIQALTPSDLDGATFPPAGAPNYFMRHRDDEVHNVGSNNPTEDYLEIWEFDIDWVTPANSTFIQTLNLPITEFDSDLCSGSFSCFPQPGTGQTLESLSQMIMWRLQYRNFGSHETLVGNLVTDVDGIDHGGIRWFELRKSGASPWSLFQEGTFAPDAAHRWMGSIAMDKNGNIGLGYSVSDSSSIFPSIRYAGRLAADPVGTLPQGEYSIVNGAAAQTSSSRWGDYSAMSVDPADDCTFWYTHEYVPASGDWQTRIATFKFDSCGPDFTVSANPASQTICIPDNAVYNVSVGQIAGFSDPVTLSSSGEPSGTTTTFSLNPVTPAGTSVMTISNTSGAAVGSYSLNITGTAGITQHSTTVQLDVYDTVPSGVTLSSPSDNATGIDFLPTLTWTAATQGITYSLEIATDLGFSNVVYSTTTSSLNHSLNSSLAPLTLYYWRIRADNVCGQGSPSSAFSFTTKDTAPILLVDDDDNTPDVRNYYTATLDALGQSYDIWDTGYTDTNEPDAATLAVYETVIWFTGASYDNPTGPGATAETDLGTWLDSGDKCLFISSQDYLYAKGGTGSDVPTSFMQTYLGLASGTSDVSQTVVTGTNTFSGLGPYTLLYPFPNFSDDLTPDGTAVLAFSGNEGIGNAAISKDTGTYRTTFHGFPFEALPTATDREMVMQTALTWCHPAPSLTITKTVEMSNNPVQLGDTITYTIVTANSGNMDATNVNITDTLPTYINGTDLTQTVTISAGKSLTYTIVVTLDNSTPYDEIITNTVYYAHTSGNGQDSVAFTVQSPNDVVNYLPLIFKDAVSAPDLVVDSLVATNSAITVTIRNMGTTNVVDAFWVDVYFNPSEAPGLNKPWDTIANHGAYWGVTKTLVPTEILTLTIGDQYFFNSSNSFLSGVSVYVFVDSINYNTAYGNVQESNEGNNLHGPVNSTVAASGSPSVVDTKSPSSIEGLPERE